MDEEPLSQRKVLKDDCCQREILICYCMNHNNGCEWKKKLLYLEEHLSNCEYREVPCLNEGCEEIRIPLKNLDQHMKESCLYKQSTCQHCGQQVPEAMMEVPCINEGCEEMIPMKKLDQHMKESCLYKQSTCQHCGQQVPEIKMEEHLQRCEKLPITCQYCGMTDILRELEKDHIENHCEAAEKPCKFKYVGCLFKGNLDDLNQHYDSQMAEEHLKLTKKTEEELKGKLEKVEKESEKLEKQLAGHVLGDRLNKAVKTEQISERTEGPRAKKRKNSFG